MATKKSKIEAMSAVRVHATGGPDALKFEEKLPLPEIKDNEVLVKIAAIGVNYIDTYHRSGLYPVKLPAIIGREGAGVVESVGSAVQGLKPGDHVAYFADNSYAEYVAVPEAKAVLVPPEIDLKTAAASMLQGMTAHYLANSTYPIQQGDWVLVHAGAGGTGGLVIEMAKIRGAKVIATVSTKEKADIVAKLGADFSILYNDVDFLEEVKKITQGKGVHVVYDGVGQSTWEKSLKCLRPRGFLVLFGNASGPVPPLDPLLLSRSGSLFLTRPNLQDYIATREELLQRSHDVFQWQAQGKIHIRVAKEFPLREAVQAHELLESRKAAGKILLIP